MVRRPPVSLRTDPLFPDTSLFRYPESVVRKRGTLTTNVLTDVEGAVIDSIRVLGGTGFFPPPEAVVISSLGTDYELFLPAQVAEMNHHIATTVPKISGTGLANGAILPCGRGRVFIFADGAPFTAQRSEEHTSELQSLMRISYAVFWLKSKQNFKK